MPNPWAGRRGMTTTSARAAGVIGSFHPVGYSFMGHIDGPHVATLRNVTGPEVGRALADAGVDYALLVPA